MSDSGLEGILMRPLTIVGPGTLGRSLAKHAAERGLNVQLVGRDRRHSEDGVQKILNSWQRAKDEGRLSPSAFQLQANRLCASTVIEDAIQDSFAIFEALPEDLPIKQKFWSDLAPSLPSTVLPLTGSSSLPASLIHNGTATGCRLQNFHLFVPVPHCPVVELASPSFTTDIERATAQNLGARLGLRVISVEETNGLVASRMGLSQGLEAMRLFEAGHASARDLDALMVLGYGHPCGPLELSDRIGLDLRLAIARHLHEVLGNPIFMPPKILKEKVANGELGRKSGKGFFAWTPGGIKA